MQKLENAQEGKSEAERVQIEQNVIDNGVNIFGSRLYEGSDEHTLEL